MFPFHCLHSRFLLDSFAVNVKMLNTANAMIIIVVMTSEKEEKKSDDDIDVYKK